LSVSSLVYGLFGVDSVEVDVFAHAGCQFKEVSD
jgi:hypothetical protein